MNLQNIINDITTNPKQLFLLDSIGALVTTILLSLVLANLESTFGMPQKTLYILSIPAAIYFLYSLLCYVRLTKNWRPYLQIIATANTFYCTLSLGMMYFNFDKLTTLGVVFFVGEIIIIMILVAIELKAISNLKQK